MKKRGTALLAALALAALVGCGGEDEGTTKADFVSQANEICEKGNKQVEARVNKFVEENDLGNQVPTKAQLAEAGEEILLPAVSAQVEEIRELEPPEGDEQKVDKILTAAEEAIEEGEKDPSRLMLEAGPFTEANKLASDYGMVKCGEE